MTREKELEAVREKGKRVRAAQLEARWLASLMRSARVGIIVPRYGHSAVERNLVKRRLREIVRIEVLPIIPVVDLVVRALPSAYACSFDDLRAQCVQLSQRVATQATPGAG